MIKPAPHSCITPRSTRPTIAKPSVEQILRALLLADQERRTQAWLALQGKLLPHPPPVSAAPLLLGVADAAKYLGVSRSTMWRLIRLGRMPIVRPLPGLAAVRRSDLERIAAGGLPAEQPKSSP